MENFYENKEVKKHMDVTHNPNRDIHNIDLHFRMLICGSSGGGKTNSLVNLIKMFCKGRGTFDEMKIFCKSKHEPLYEYLSDISKGTIEIIDDLSLLPQINELNKSKQRLFVFDDLVLDKNPLISEYWLRGRKANCSLIFLSQSYYATNKFIRVNTRYFVLLKLSGTRDLNAILRELSMDKTKKELLDIYEYATGEPLSCLVIDNDRIKNKFRKNFTEIIS